jgi:hypothetical protein
MAACRFHPKVAMRMILQVSKIHPSGEQVGNDYAVCRLMKRSSHLVRNRSVKSFSLRWLVCTVTLIALPALHANFVTLVWNPSVASVAGYKIYYGTASGVYTNSIDVGNVTNVTVTGLSQYTTYYFAAKSYDTFGVLSDFSNETKLMVYPVAAITPNQTANGGGTGKPAFNVSGVNNYLYVVQASTDLVHWVAVATNVAPFSFVDPNASQFSRRFYRTVNVHIPTVDSIPAFAPTPFVNGQLTFNVSGVTNVPLQYVVQASTDLVNWVSLQTNTSPFVFVDTNASQFSQRFYRTYYLPSP